MGRGAARISEFFLYKESGRCFFFFFFIKNPNLIKKIGGWEGRGGGVARVSDFFFRFSKESKSEYFFFLFEGVKVREDWLV